MLSSVTLPLWFWGLLLNLELGQTGRYKFWKGHKYSNQGTPCVHCTKTGKLDSSVARWRPSEAFGVYGLGVETTTLLCSDPERQHSTLASLDQASVTIVSTPGKRWSENPVTAVFQSKSEAAREGSSLSPTGQAGKPFPANCTTFDGSSYRECVQRTETYLRLFIMRSGCSENNPGTTVTSVITFLCNK